MRGSPAAGTSDIAPSRGQGPAKSGLTEPRCMQPILDIADLGHRREAAEATAAGAALFYAFGNFCALAARPDLESLRAMNALKGRPLDQVGSVTTTPERGKDVFDWDRVMLPWSALVAVMADLHALGPIGFRGPAADWIPEHLTVADA